MTARRPHVSPASTTRDEVGVDSIRRDTPSCRLWISTAELARPAATDSPEPAPNGSLTIATPTTTTGPDPIRVRTDHGTDSGHWLGSTSDSSRAVVSGRERSLLPNPPLRDQAPPPSAAAWPAGGRPWRPSSAGRHQRSVERLRGQVARPFPRPRSLAAMRGRPARRRQPLPGARTREPAPAVVPDPRGQVPGPVKWIRHTYVGSRGLARGSVAAHVRPVRLLHTPAPFDAANENTVTLRRLLVLRRPSCSPPTRWRRS